jgi:hypothetical protein
LEVKCPPECKVELDHIKNDIKGLDTSRKYLETEMAKRIKITTLITVTVIALGVLSGLLSVIWIQGKTTAIKVDVIREHQVRVLTVLELKGLLRAAERKEMEKKDERR